MNERLICVGIDPGTRTTGFAVWNRNERRLVVLRTLTFAAALMELEEIRRVAVPEVRFEDARLRRWFGKTDAKIAKYGMAVREGAGAVKALCTVLEDYLTMHNIKHLAVKPAAGTTKLKADRFNAITGWTEKSSEHSRDAGMLVYGL